MTVVSDSSQFGFVREDSPAVLEDPVLTDLLQSAVWQITGLTANMVRPRWQDMPPNQPRIDQSWCAIGVVNRTPQDYPYITHQGWAENGAGNDLIIDWSTFEVLASFYGPDAAANAGRLRRGFYVEQNRYTLAANGIKVREVTQVVSVPDLFNQQYVDHVDVHIYMARELQATFPIRNIASATTEIITDTGCVITAETDLNTPDQPFILDHDVNGILNSQQALD